jgi:hypothetical protein
MRTRRAIQVGTRRRTVVPGLATEFGRVSHRPSLGAGPQRGGVSND